VQIICVNFISLLPVAISFSPALPFVRFLLKMFNMKLNLRHFASFVSLLSHEIESVAFALFSVVERERERERESESLKNYGLTESFAYALSSICFRFAAPALSQSPIDLSRPL
jgi:hypothetical protein